MKTTGLPGLDFFNQCLCLEDPVPAFRRVKGRTWAGQEADRLAALVSAERGETSEGVQQRKFADNSICTSKYNLFSFLPRALFEQFRRLANVYFLGISLLMLLGTYSTVFDSPLQPWSTLFPLLLMLSIIIGKEAMEDLKRHKSDKQTNNRIANRLSTKQPQVVPDTWAQSWEQVAWKSLSPGDIVRVDDRTEIPADIVLLATSEEAGLGYVETSNIDGETNLKIKGSAPTALDGSGPAWGCSKEEALSMNSWVLELECEPENERIHSFEGTLSIYPPDTQRAGASQAPDVRKVSLDQSNLLLRGSSIRNTKWAVGIVAYTGAESKLVMNSSEAPSKFSNLEMTVNRLIWIVFGAQFVLAIISLIGYSIFKDVNYGTMFYLCYDHLKSGIALFRDNCETTGNYSDAGYFFTFFILYNNFIPISIYVTIEICNYFQANYIEYDLQMYDPESNTPALARTSNMNSDLGQISYVFSDKTGTLTQNIMKFKMCSVGGKIYAQSETGQAGVPLSELQNEALIEDSPAFLFILCMAACHTVVVEVTENGEKMFQAESPDEEALVKAAQDLGFQFTERTPNSVTVSINGMPLTYEIFAVIPFDSTRKRMSVVVKTPTDKYIVFSKGADNIMLALATNYGGENITHDLLDEHLDVFASEGLRTLVLSYRVLSEGDFSAWFKSYKAASVSLEDRQGQIAACADAAEKDLTVLGITAIEDKLQDEVPEVINDLGNAGIKVWVLTGDKVETAINIGYSCRLLLPNMLLIRLQNRADSSTTVKEQVRLLHRHFKRLIEDTITFGEIWANIRKGFGGGDGGKSDTRSSAASELPTTLPEPLLTNTEQAPKFEELTSDHLGLVVDGPALLEILDDPQIEKMFLQLAQLCRSVIACRVSPLQKRLIVRLVKLGSTKKPITLAIGDGANDVGMIQEAQVGVGISGKEGRQAVNSSDFAIAQFKFLRNLMLVHGRWNYRRICKVVLYSFYKNMVLAFILFYFTTVSGWSGQSLYDSYVYSGYNFFLGMPIVCIGLFDKDVMYKTALSAPILYMSGLKNMDMSMKIMAAWLLQGIIESLIIFLFVWGCDQANGGVWARDGHSEGLWVFGTTVFSCLVFGMLFKAAFMCYSWNGVTWFFWVGSMLLYFTFILVYASNDIQFSYDFYFVSYFMNSRAIFWLLLILLPAITFLLDLTVNSIRLEFLHNPIDHAMEFERGFSTDNVSDLRRHRAESRSASFTHTQPPEKEFMKPITNFFNFVRIHVGLSALHQLNKATTEQEQESMGLQDTTKPRRTSYEVPAGATASFRRYSSSYAFDHPTTGYGPGGGEGSPQNGSRNASHITSTRLETIGEA